MTSEIRHHPEGMSTEDALTASSELTRCLARATVSDFAQRMMDWVNDELQREEPATVLYALCKFQIQTHASIAGQLLAQDGCQRMGRIYADYAAEIYEKHAAAASALFDENACRECGCTEHQACMTEAGPCHWVEPDLCSACSGEGASE